MSEQFVPDLSSPAAAVASCQAWAEACRQQAERAADLQYRQFLMDEAERADAQADGLAKAFGL